MERIIGSDHPYIQTLNARIMEGTGKRLRPKLLILCTRMLECDSSDAVLYGACFELIHTATLIHDDMIDDATTRRGRTTMHEQIGNTLTVLYGDLVYIRAHRAAAQAGRLSALVAIDKVSEKMIEGELLQNQVNYNLDIDRETYFDILTRKTAYLFAGTTQVAGLTAGLDDEACEALFQFGFHLGTSFQLIDDYLDYTGNAEAMGKPVLSDLLGGKVTLPVIHALAADNGSLRAGIQAIWDEELDEVPRHLADVILQSGGLQETRQLAAEAAERAGEALARVPVRDNQFSMMVQALPAFLLSRIN